jgi:hypothetical protein
MAASQNRMMQRCDGTRRMHSVKTGGGAGMRGVPDGKVFARGSRVMHGVLHVKRNRTAGAETRSNNR